MESSSVTIKELSFLSGYSISTVSKALNNKLEISKATRDTIKTIAKQYNYVPNNYAVSLRAKKSQSIAVVLPEVTKKSYNQALYYLQKTAADLGYRILLYQSFNCSFKESNYINNLNDGSIYGIIVVSKEGKSNFNKTTSIPLQFIQIEENISVDKIELISTNSLMKLIEG